MSDGQDVSPAAHGKVFTELPAHWGLEEPSIVTHDFGGAVALRTRPVHGARHRSLTLVDPMAPAQWGSPCEGAMQCAREPLERLRVRPDEAEEEPTAALTAPLA